MGTTGKTIEFTRSFQLKVTLAQMMSGSRIVNVYSVSHFSIIFIQCQNKVYYHKMYLRNENMVDFVELGPIFEQELQTFPLLKIQFPEGEIFIDSLDCYEGEDRKGEWKISKF